MVGEDAFADYGAAFGPCSLWKPLDTENFDGDRAGDGERGRQEKAIVEFQGWQRFRLYVSVFKINN